MTEEEILGELKRLFATAKKIDDFEFVNILIGYNGMGDQRALTHLYESRAYIADMKAQLAAAANKHTKARLGLHIYCHIFEMDELYNILGNLLRVAINQKLRYLPELYNGREDILLTPTDKFYKLNDLAEQCKFEELIKGIEDYYSNKIRNAFLHSAYSLIEDDFCIVKGDGIVIGNSRYNSVSIDGYLMPLIDKTIGFADELFRLIDESKLSYKGNKIVTARMPNIQPVVILGDKEKGLIGFQTFVGSWIKIIPAYGTEYFVEAMNLRLDHTGGPHAALAARLEAYIEKLTPFGKEFNEIRDEVLVINDPSLMRSLAIVYYNWANNTAATAVGKPIRQQKAIFDSAIERYQLSIKADPTLGMAYHNWGTSLLKRAELNNSKDLKLRNEALALFDKTLTLDSNMYEAWLNSARMLSEIANEEADKEKQIAMFNESIKRYRAAIEIYPRDSQPFSNLGWIYRRLGHLIGDREHFIQSITSYEQALKIKPNLENTLNLSTVLAESAEANSENAEDLLDKGIKLLQDAQQSYGNSSDLSYRLGNKYMFKGHYLDESINLSLAASCFKVAVELDASNTRAMNNWSHNEIMQAANAQDTEKKSELLESAKARLEHAMTIDPTNKHAWFNLGLIEKMKSELVTGAEKNILLDAAIGHHLKAEAIKPGHSSLELARIFSLKGDLDQAFKWLEIWLTGPKGNIAELQEDEDFNTLKDDQRYQALMPLS